MSTPPRLHGADPNADGPGFTALHWAAGSWETETTGPLGIMAPPDHEWSAMGGVQIGKQKLVESLLDHGADPNVHMRDRPLRYGMTKPARNEKIRDSTPFMLAALAGEVDIMQMLVDRGADPLAKTEFGTTAIMLAAGVNSLTTERVIPIEDSLAAIKLCEDLGADINEADTYWGHTPMHGAAQLRSVELIRYLVDQGADVNAMETWSNTTPLMWAVAEGHAEVAADRAGSGLAGVCRAYQAADDGDGVDALEGHGDDGAAGHEPHQGGVEGLVGVDRVVLLDDLVREVAQLEADEPQALALEAAEDGADEAALDGVGLGDEQACGRHSIRPLLTLARQKGLKVRTVDVRNSGDTAGTKDKVVGYGSWLFTESEKPPKEDEDQFGNATRAMLDAHGASLLKLGARTILNHLGGQKQMRLDMKDFPEPLHGNGACFVTLNKDGKLRGCIGTIQAHRPLITDAAENAGRAAFRDQRFKPLAAEELTEHLITMHISVLSPQVAMTISGEADLVEEVARIVGYENIPTAASSCRRSGSNCPSARNSSPI